MYICWHLSSILIKQSNHTEKFFLLLSMPTLVYVCHNIFAHTFAQFLQFSETSRTQDCFKLGSISLL